MLGKLGTFLVAHNLNYLKWINKYLFKTDYLAHKEMIKIALHNGGFFAMDDENSETIEHYYDISFDNHQFLPVPCPEISLNIEENSALPSYVEALKAFWYGRLCDFKVYGLLNFIEQTKHDNIELHIIGSGDMANEVQSCCKKNNIRFIMYGTLGNGEALDLINKDADLVLAMGTAALECALLKKPIIISPISYAPLKEKEVFYWLFETSNYTIGRIIKKDECGFRNWEEMKKDLFTQPVGEYCRQHAIENHSLSTVINKLVISIGQCSFDYEKYQKIKEQYSGGFLNFLRYLKSRWR